MDIFSGYLKSFLQLPLLRLWAVTTMIQKTFSSFVYNSGSKFETPAQIGNKFQLVDADNQEASAATHTFS